MSSPAPLATALAPAPLATTPVAGLSTDASETLVQKTIEFVSKSLAGNDASHDFSHIQRVHRLALRLAKEEGVKDTEVVELAALLHDIDDWKYSGSETAGVEAAGAFLTAQGYDPAKTKQVQDIIEGVGFKGELGRETKAEDVAPELRVVQDADRLDAIGAIGIARCFTYGGAKNRVLHDPAIPPKVGMTKEEYMKNKNGTTINHFYEKLLTLKDRMKSEAGKREALRRHEFMEGFLAQFHKEWDGE